MDEGVFPLVLNDLSPLELIIIASFEDRSNEPFLDDSERVLGTFSLVVNAFLPSEDEVAPLLTSPTGFDIFFFGELPGFMVGDTCVAIGFEDPLPGDLGTFSLVVNEFLPSEDEVGPLFTSPTDFDVFFFDELPGLIVGDAGVAIGFEDDLPEDLGTFSLVVNGAMPSEDEAGSLLTLPTVVGLLFFDELPGLLVGDGDVAIDFVDAFEDAFDEVSNITGGETLVFVGEGDLEFCCPGRSTFWID